VAAYEAAVEAATAAAAAAAAATGGFASFDRLCELQRRKAGLGPEPARRQGRPRAPRWGDAYHDGSDEEARSESEELQAGPTGRPPTLAIRRILPPRPETDMGPPGAGVRPRPAAAASPRAPPRTAMPLPPREPATVVIRLSPAPAAEAAECGGLALPPLPKPVWTVPSQLKAASVAKLLAQQVSLLPPPADADGAELAPAEITDADVLLGVGEARVPDWQTMGDLRRASDALGAGNLVLLYWRRKPVAAPAKAAPAPAPAEAGLAEAPAGAEDMEVQLGASG